MPSKIGSIEQQLLDLLPENGEMPLDDYKQAISNAGLAAHTSRITAMKRAQLVRYGKMRDANGKAIPTISRVVAQ